MKIVKWIPVWIIVGILSYFATGAIDNYFNNQDNSSTNSQTQNLINDVSGEYQIQYDEKYNAFSSLRVGDLIPQGLNNVYDEQNNPNLEKAKWWCEENFVKMENISREVNGLQPFTEDEYNGAIDGCADAFMEKAGN